MFKLRISKKNDILYYKPSILAKIPYAILLTILIWGAITELSSLSILAWFLALLSLVGVLYVETWVFDNKNQVIISKFGIYPFIKKRSFNYNEVESIQINHFIRGLSEAMEEKQTNEETDHSTDNKKRKRGQKPMVVLEFDTQTEATKIQIEIIEESKSGGRTEAAAQAISLHTSLPLNIDRPRDMGPTMKLRDLPKRDLR